MTRYPMDCREVATRWLSRRGSGEHPTTAHVRQESKIRRKASSLSGHTATTCFLSSSVVDRRNGIVPGQAVGDGKAVAHDLRRHVEPERAHHLASTAVQRDEATV